MDLLNYFMTQQIIDVGNVTNDGQGDPIRTAFIKTNENFSELYNSGGKPSIENGNSNVYVYANGNVATSVSNIANIFVVTATGTETTGTSNTIGDINASANVSASYFVGM